MGQQIHGARPSAMLLKMRCWGAIVTQGSLYREGSGTGSRYFTRDAIFAPPAKRQAHTHRSGGIGRRARFRGV